MTASFEMKWYGEELRKNVAKVSEKNVRDMARRVQKRAFKLAPVDLGGYRESIEFRMWKNNGIFGAYVEGGQPGLEYLSFFLELGTPGDVYTSGAYKGQKRQPIAPAPHLRPALRSEEKAFVNSFKDAL